ncbi:MAG: twin-arginine translocase subunit TatC [Nitrosomonadales bacterium]|nr:twin-arginine translocase subunit TatC [Nitrosomonadales bacterium]MBT5150724.1 twin-arginine translocase subunit TatC [Nitrosomonadales bacterium]MBT5573549.1 twin-arginine translocase subunit TatC [Nitrosomonadales bacterium]MBT6818056.1 twin-arginine translocase subunit TatC [Nitrosomonadales bacterium]MBT7407791.1 twin-arginine translocase subunit TatC [Nitrosomonadales bacterium]
MKKQTLFLSHFKDLRTVLIKSSIIFLVIFISLFSFSNEIYEFFAEPLIDQLSAVNGSLISTKLTATFIAPFKITLFVALIISLPFIFSQIWKFIKPGLYKKEKAFILSASILSFCLFVAGLVFVYLILFPNIFRFFIVMAPGNVDLMIDISQYLEMILALFFAFGIAFQIPIVLISIVKFKLFSIKKIKSNRAYIYVGAFIFAAIFTPPDVISQILLAIPVILLFEMGVLISTKLFKN